MTCPVTYADLLAKYQPKAIDTEEENDAAIAIAEELDDRQNRTVEEDALSNSRRNPSFDAEALDRG
jgi:hypothetical protein